MAASFHAPRFLVPEVTATGEMDAGVSVLDAVLRGYGHPVPHEQLRELSESIGDLNSLETLKLSAQRYGLDAQQILLPADHLFIAEAFPALVIARSSTNVQFLVLWRRVLNWIQVLDLHLGRRWLDPGELLNTLQEQSIPISVSDWRAQAASPFFLNPLRKRLNALNINPDQTEIWLARATDDRGWETLARLDATVRMTAALVRAQALKRGPESTRVIERFLSDPALVIPSQYYSVTSTSTEQLVQCGIILLQITAPIAENHPITQSPKLSISRSLHPSITDQPTTRPTDPPTASVPNFEQVLELMRADGLVTPIILGIALVLATVGVMVQALLFQGILDLTALLRDPNQRLVFLGAIFLFMLILFAVEIPINALLLQMGRKLEVRFRLRFLRKIPYLGERFFYGHLKSDLVQRAHSLRQLHLLPELAVTLFRLGFQLVLTTLGIIWLDPASAPLAVLATVIFLALAYFTSPLLQERDFRLRTQMGALSRFYLDAMLGLVPLKMHGAQRAFRREYEGLVHDWAGANWNLARLSNWLQALSVFVYSVFAVWLVLDFIGRNGTTAGTLLFFFWILSLPVLATALVQAIQQYPSLRSLTLRVLEPLNAPDENNFSPVAGRQSPVASLQSPSPTFPSSTVLRPSSVSIDFTNVTVQLGGNLVLHNINLHLRAGEHLAIVGPSGAGKTTLVGLLLGWHQPIEGECRTDGEIVAGAHLQALRRATAWVDPAIQLWNRTLWENVLYGNAPHDLASPSSAIENADLLPVVEQFDAGLETILGESGGLVSGGEGQRVRLARGMAREGTRLVILDEPFRGLDRETRRKLLARAREFWHDVTLICVTHDVNETRSFERVIVIENGRIVEDAPPAELAENPASRYRALLEGEEAVRSGLWSNSDWRKLWIQDGTLREERTL